MSSGLYEKLIEAGLIIPHQEVDTEPEEPSQAYQIVQPEPLQFVSYPFEWSFSQLKDAALTTLKIQLRAFAAGMSLKDCSAYNIQFHRGRPVLIDTLSFEVYRKGEPWVAYRQFCQHFLAPLALMSHKDVRLALLLRDFIDGIPLDLASTLLPRRTHLDFGLLTHIHLHASAQRRYADKPVDKEVSKRRMSRNAFQGLIEGLQSTVRKLKWEPAGTEWGDYYPETSSHYSTAALDHKKELVAEFLAQAQPHSVWDLGANIGLFSRIASDQGIPTIAFDIDPAAVEQNYLDCVSRKEAHMLPLLQDLTNPSPGIGWQNRERMSLLERAPVDAVMALALIHHLAISNNVSLDQLAEFFHQLGKWLIIEFVPKTDSQVQLLLASRVDIFPDYNKETFEKTFGEWFNLHTSATIRDSQRSLYLMESR
jgi:ribosomal protein L11 methylase PrmA